MASQNNNKGNGSLIFTWVLIILLAIGTFVVVNNYSANNSTLITNDEVGKALSDAFDKPVGRITEEDLASVEGVLFYKDLPMSFDGTTTTGMSAVEFYLDGYTEAFDAYNAEGITEEEKASLVNPADLSGYIQLTDLDIWNDIKLLKNITTFNAYNYGASDTENDVLKFAAENFPALNELMVYGYATEDFNVVGGLTELTSLTVIDDSLTDISAVKGLTKLETLSLASSGIEDISAVANLKALKNLSVSGSAITDISPVAGLENLEQIDLSDNNITDISALSSINNEKLTTLRLTGNAITNWEPVEHIDAEKIVRDEPETDSEAITEEETSGDVSDNAEDSSEEQ